MKNRFLAGAAALVLLAGCAGQPPTPAEGSLEQLIAATASADANERWNALGRLKEMGPAAAPAVPRLVAMLSAAGGPRASVVVDIDRTKIVEALGAVGPAAVEAVPAIIQQITLGADGDDRYLFAAVEAIVPEAEARGKVYGDALLQPGAAVAGRRSLILALRNLPGGQATSALGKAFAGESDAELRGLILWGLTSPGRAPADVVQVLALAAGDPDDEVRNGALRHLEKLDAEAEAVVPALLAVLERRPGDSSDKHLALKALAKQGRGALPALPTLKVLLKDETLASDGIDVLKAIPPEGLDALAEALPTLPLHHQDAALQALGASGPDAARHVLAMARLHRENEYSRALNDALRAAAPRAVERLVAALEGDSVDDSVAAARALGLAEAAAAPAVPSLIGRLKSEDARLRRTALEALANIGPPARAAQTPLLAMLRDDAFAEARFELVLALGRISRDENAATENAATENAATENAATENAAMEIVATEIVATEIVALLKTASHPLDQGCWRALNEMGAAAAPAVPTLVDWIHDAKHAAAARKLVQSIGPAALDPLRPLVDHAEPRRRAGALLCLAALGPEARPAWSAAQARWSDADPEARRAAIIASLAIAPSSFQDPDVLPGLLREDRAADRDWLRLTLGDERAAPPRAETTLPAEVAIPALALAWVLENNDGHRQVFARLLARYLPPEARSDRDQAIDDAGLPGLDHRALPVLPFLTAILTQSLELPPGENVSRATLAMERRGQRQGRAARALGMIGPRAAEAAGPLVAATGVGGSYRARVSERSPGSRDALFNKVEKWRDARDDAAEALRSIGPDCLPRIEPLLRGESAQDRRLAAAALGLFPAEAERLVAPLKPLLGDADSAVRIAALRSLTNLGDKARGAADEVEALLADERAETRQAAALCLARVDPNRSGLAVPVLIETRDLDLIAAAQAVAELGAEGAAAVGPIVESLRKHPNQDARWKVLLSLGRMGPSARAATPYLQARARDERVDASERYACLAALLEIDRQAVESDPALVRFRDAELAETRRFILAELVRARSGRPDELRRAVRALGPLAGREGVPYLVTLLRDRDPATVRVVLAALEEMGPDAAAALPTLTELAERHSDIVVRLAAQNALRRVQGETK